MEERQRLKKERVRQKNTGNKHYQEKESGMKMKDRKAPHREEFSQKMQRRCKPKSRSKAESWTKDRDP